jgi:hypothetical protein
MLKQGLDVEESDMRLVPVKTDGGTEIENTLESQTEEIDRITQEIESVSDSLETSKLIANIRNISLLIGLAWIYLQLEFTVGSAITLSTGVLLILLLILPLVYQYNLIEKVKV